MEKADFPWEIRAAHREEWQDAMALAWKTFLNSKRVIIQRKV